MEYELRSQRSDITNVKRARADIVVIASDPVINQDVTVLTFWRLITLPPTQVPSDGESHFGVLTYNTLTYNAVGQNLVSYLTSP